MAALLGLVTHPFIALLITLALVAGVTGPRLGAPAPCADGHHFRRHPSGVWRCSECPETRDRHGRTIA